VLLQLWFRLPAVAYAALLFWASSKSRLPLPDIGLGFEDKIAHLLAYAVLAWLVHRALSKPRRLTASVLSTAWLLSAGYALSDELHQRFVPGRQCDLWDLAFDVVGITLTLVLLGRLRPEPRAAEGSV
jgi:VanZ family protein